MTALENLKAHQRQLDADGVEVGVSRQALDEVIAEVGRLRRVATDRQYMMEAYRNMLGGKGLEVATMWEKTHVMRVHFDWADGAAALTGEQRAEFILGLEKAPTRLVENIDFDLPTERFDLGASQ